MDKRYLGVIHTFCGQLPCSESPYLNGNLRSLCATTPRNSRQTSKSSLDRSLHDLCEARLSNQTLKMHPRNTLCVSSFYFLGAEFLRPTEYGCTLNSITLKWYEQTSKNLRAMGNPVSRFGRVRLEVILH